MEEFYQSFIDYIENNTGLKCADKPSVCIYTSSLKFISKNLMDPHHYHASLLIKFSSINDLLNAAAEITIAANTSAVGSKTTEVHKRLSMNDFNEFVKRGTIVEMCNLITDYECRATEAETNFLLNCEVALL